MDLSKLTSGLAGYAGPEISPNEPNTGKSPAASHTAVAAEAVTDRFTPSTSPASGNEPTIDTVTLVSTAAAAKTGDTRSQRLAEIQAAIANGTYKISSADVAASVMNKMRGAK